MNTLITNFTTFTLDSSTTMGFYHSLVLRMCISTTTTTTTAAAFYYDSEGALGTEVREGVDTLHIYKQ